jgi:stearoyl-CoA desaturase (delta-9 desaturase)
MSQNKENRKISWENIGFITVSSLAMLIWLPWYLFFYEDKSITLIVISFLYFIISGLSISAGYHRYFCHRSFEASKVLKFVFLAVGASVWQGPLANWMSEHKLHHMHPETDKDPYPIKHGFWWAYLGWLFYRKKPILIPEVTNDPWIMFQYRHYKIIAFTLSFGLGILLGYLFGKWWEGLLLIGFVRTYYVQHTTFLINSWGHSWGYQINDKHTAHNDHFLAFLSMGEGYHNNHHTYPQYYTTQIKSNEFDFTKYFILFCEKTGLASKLKKK